MAPTISPTAFKQHMNQLLSDFTRCHELCDSILQNRRTGSKHESLDRLQDGLRSSAHVINIEFAALRKIFGSRMDLGDEVARQAIKANIREIEFDIVKKLADIASRRNEGLPGFRDMLRHVERIEDSVADTLAALGQRLERPAEKKVEKKSEIPKPAPMKKKHDDVVISIKELEKYTDLMKNSWMETVVTGKILYVNCWDEKRNQWERPSGFIKELPKPPKVRRVPSWERTSSRQDSWSRPAGYDY